MVDVYIIGAGPGDPELITRKGYRLVQEADVVIYAGSLVNPAILEACKPSCEIHNSATMNLDEVLAVMKASVEAGKSVVRLHTGDPAIYGAIQEQMDALASMGISYEVVPGVSSFLATAAALKTRIYIAKCISNSHYYAYGRSYTDASKGKIAHVSIS